MEVTYEEEGAREIRAGVELNSKMEQIVLEGVTANKLMIATNGPSSTTNDKEETGDIIMKTDDEDDEPTNSKNAEEELINIPSNELPQLMNGEECISNPTGNGLPKTEETRSQINESLSVLSSPPPEILQNSNNSPVTTEGATSGSLSLAAGGFSTPVTAAPLTPNNFLGTGNANSSSSLLSSTKKSNLRKYSKYDQEYNSDGTPKDPNPTPRKRIRIVENFEDSLQSSDSMLLDDALIDIPEHNDLIDPVSTMHRTNRCNEEILWVSPSVRPLDFAMINIDTVAATRLPISKKFNVELDMHFIDSETITNLLGCKASVHQVGAYFYENLSYDNCPFRDFQRESASSFKYEANAMKLANLDAALDFDLTFPKNIFECQKQENDSSSVFYFADIWVTSKGFREYILWKSQEHLSTKGTVCKGFALNTLNLNSFKTGSDYYEKPGIIFSSIAKKVDVTDEELEPLPIELVEHFAGEGSDTSRRELDLSDINVSDGFVKSILDGTDGQGVHLLVVDNPEYFNINENVREVRFQRKLYCQCIVALLAIREGGNFVLKIFDSVTLFTVGLIFLMHRCFKSIAIHKPKSSGAHSSERFLICRDKLRNDETDEITQILLQCHSIVMKNEEVRRIARKKFRKKLEITRMEVKGLVPLRVIIGHAEFFEFMRLTNIRMTKNLVEGIENLCLEAGFRQQYPPPTIIGTRPKTKVAKDSRDSLINSLNINISSELSKKFTSPAQFVSSLLKDGMPGCACDTKEFKLSEENQLMRGNLENITKSSQVWRVFPMQDLKKALVVHGISLFVGFGGEEIYYFDGIEWKGKRVEGLVLTKGTLLYGEITEEIFCAPNKSDKFSLTFHIIDGLSLNGKFIANLSFHKRQELCRSYSAALNRNLISGGPVTFRVRDPVALSQLSGLVNSITEKEIIGDGRKSRVCQFNDHDSRYFMAVGGFLFWNIRDSAMVSLAERIFWKWEVDGTNGKDNTVELKDLMNLKL